jgi:hypothetical protein
MDARTTWSTRSALLAFVLLVSSPATEHLPAAQAAAPPAATRAALPARLTDAEFWTLVSDVSEPGGYFRITDNYTSNEREIGVLSTMLHETGVKGGVYMGVGPEQNFSYIAAIRPAMAFVVDIRRQAVVQHLMFKAIFEMAAERADFISLLFSKPKPAGLDASTSIQKIWEAFTPVATDAPMGRATYNRLADLITRTHGITLTAEESTQMREVFDAFQIYGPSITTRGGFGGGGNSLTFADLTGWATDASGVPQSFLSTEDNYKFVKSLQEKNLVVPASGDFGGPKAIRAVGAYVRAHGSTVTAFYLSNVEQYLFQDGKQKAFYDNVSTLPMTDKTVFIRPYSLRGRGGNPLCPIGPFVAAFNAGRVFSNNEALACVQ